MLAHPLPAERLILYEVYVPRGGWSGWPPHCHDGYEGSPYLEETYYFRLDPADGWAILNADDARVAGMVGHTAASVRTYGFAADADVRATDIASLGTEGMRFTLHAAGAVREVSTPVLGRHGVHNALAAVAVAEHSGWRRRDIYDLSVKGNRE